MLYLFLKTEDYSNKVSKVIQDDLYKEIKSNA